MSIHRHVPPPGVDKKEEPPTYDHAADSLLINPARLASKKHSRVVRGAEDGPMHLDLAKNWKINHTQLAGIQNPYKLVYDLQARVLTEKKYEDSLMKLSKASDDMFAIPSANLLDFFSMVNALTWAHRLDGEFREQSMLFLKHMSSEYVSMTEMLGEQIKQDRERNPELPSVEFCQWWNQVMPDYLMMAGFAQLYFDLTEDGQFLKKTAVTKIPTIATTWNVEGVIEGWLMEKSPVKHIDWGLMNIRRRMPTRGKFQAMVERIQQKSFMPDEGVMGVLRNEKGKQDDNEIPFVMPPDLREAVGRVPESSDIYRMRGMRLNLKKRVSRETIYFSEGTRIATGRLAQAVIRDSTANLFFQRRFTKNIRGGTVVIDSSGSMGITSEHIIQLVKSAPGATVAYYGGSENLEDNSNLRKVKKPKTGQAMEGTIVIAAENGKISSMLDRGDIPNCGGGNEVDLDAVRWLMNMPKPWYLVSDLQFCGGVPGQARQATQLVEIMKRTRHLTIYHSVQEALEKFKEMEENDK